MSDKGRYPLENVAGALGHSTQWIAEKVNMRDHGKDYSINVKCKVGDHEHEFHANIGWRYANKILEHCIAEQQKEVHGHIAEIRARLKETEELMATDKLTEYGEDE